MERSTIECSAGALACERRETPNSPVRNSPRVRGGHSRQTTSALCELEGSIRLTHSVHIKQTQPRYAALFKQPFAHVLLVQLLNLRRRHVPPIRRQIAIRLRPNINE